MSAIAAFVLGLLIGWVVEWIIDWIYWRRKSSVLQSEVAQLSENLKQVESRNADLEHQLTLQKVNLTNLQEKLASTEAELAQVRSQLEAQKQVPFVQNETLSQPAPEPEVSSEAMAQPEEAVSFAAVEEPTAEEPVIAPAAEGVLEPTRAVSIERDDLEIIKGIGPVIARKLNQSGIYCFADLAAITPDRLRELVGDIISRLADEDSIIEQAKQLAEQKKSGG